MQPKSVLSVVACLTMTSLKSCHASSFLKNLGLGLNANSTNTTSMLNLNSTTSSTATKFNNNDSTSTDSVIGGVTTDSDTNDDADDHASRLLQSDHDDDSESSKYCWQQYQGPLAELQKDIFSFVGSTGFVDKDKNPDLQEDNRSLTGLTGLWRTCKDLHASVTDTHIEELTKGMKGLELIVKRNNSSTTSNDPTTCLEAIVSCICGPSYVPYVRVPSAEEYAKNMPKNIPFVVSQISVLLVMTSFATHYEPKKTR